MTPLLFILQLCVSLARASEGGEGHAEGGIPTEAIVFAGINLAIFAVLLVWFAGKPVSEALVSRARSVRSGLDEAARLQREAQERHAAVEARLSALGRQIEDMKTEARDQADRELATLRERGDTEVIRLRDAAERTIREETARARAAIRGEAAAAAVALAKEILRNEVTVEDQQKLARQFLDLVDKEASHG